MTQPERPLPPDPTGGATCDGGHCAQRSAGWRWDADLNLWMPVCLEHSAGAEPDDYVADDAMVWREGRPRYGRMDAPLRTGRKG